MRRPASASVSVSQVSSVMQSAKRVRARMSPRKTAVLPVKLTRPERAHAARLKSSNTVCESSASHTCATRSVPRGRLRHCTAAASSRASVRSADCSQPGCARWSASRIAMNSAEKRASAWLSLRCFARCPVATTRTCRRGSSTRTWMRPPSSSRRPPKTPRSAATDASSNASTSTHTKTPPSCVCARSVRTVSMSAAPSWCDGTSTSTSPATAGASRGASSRRAPFTSTNPSNAAQYPPKYASAQTATNSRAPESVIDQAVRGRSMRGPAARAAQGATTQVSTP